MPATLTAHVDSLDWPGEEEGLETITIECAGKTFLIYHSLFAAGDDFEFSSSDEKEDDNDDDDESDPGLDEKKDDDLPPPIDLFGLDEHGLEELDYYKVLHLPFRSNVTPDDVKKAYRKACLKYHPDKSGRGEEDAVFLKVKAAFDTLSTQKVAYDSTEMTFDERLPDENPSNFFEEYAPVFQLNLHFDARLLSNKQQKKNNRRKSRNSKVLKPPSLGDESTPIEQVHEFYDYWAHFESWRDFTLRASRELETCDQLEQAESRYEKRWYQNEINKRAKKLKQAEQSRITTLLERAMAADPRLQNEKKRLKEEKEERQRKREQEALDKKRQEEEAKLAAERRLKEEEEKKKEEKLIREKEKKQLRKTKQAFKKYVGDALASLLEPEHALEDEVDLICSELNREQLTKMNTNLESKSSPGEVLELVKKRAANLQAQKQQEEEAAATEEAKNASSKATNGTSSTTSSSNSKIPFTKDEMSALAKGVKKFPPGGANRWDQIANYINNVCRPDTPRTREECIETFNQNKVTKPTNRNGTSNPTTAAETNNAKSNGENSNNNNNNDDDWTEEQDKQLQSGLATFPASMDKNERWTSIAKGVTGKTKKQCVQRFKAIREAIKNKKQ